MKKHTNNPRETFSISLHPTIRQWLRELAVSDYDGNVSAAVTGLILYDRAVRQAKRYNHESHAHHLTRGIPQRAALLEAAIREISGLDPGLSPMTWLDIAKKKAENPQSG